MKSCTKCNYNFTFSDRLKAFLSLNGHLECPQCYSVYRPKDNMYRGMYYFLVIYICMFLSDKIVLEINLENFILKLVLQIFIMIVSFSLFDVIPNGYQEYKKIN